MSAFADRRTEDLKKLHDLAARSNGKLRVVRSSGDPPSDIALSFNLKTARSSSYPKEIQNGIMVAIKLPARYPFQEPSAHIETPIFHPNVYTSGMICFGIKWLPTQGLELLARRIAQIVIFDPTILNEQSPANSAAREWYRGAIRDFPGSFPTDTFDVVAAEQKRGKISWTDVSEPVQPRRVTVRCPQCSTQVSLPSGRSGMVRCPSCQKRFEVST
jgi:ubiquitin-protein ligase